MSKEDIETLHVSVGYACNNACIFCMESNIPGLYDSVRRLISAGRMYRDMDTHGHMRKVSFGRGEPTLNPDLPKYVAYAKKVGFRDIAVISNGRRYADRDYCKTLIGSGVTEFIVSVHGHTKELHETLTRRKDSFAETTDGLKNLSDLKQEQSFRIVVNHVVNKTNCPFIGDFLKYMRGYSIDVIVLSVVQPIWWGNRAKLFPALMPRYSDVAKRIDGIRRRNPEWFLPDAGGECVSIIDLPWCCSSPLVGNIGFKEKRVSEQDERAPDSLAVAGKSKGLRCRECVYDGICDGVYDAYTSRFGWGEFVPVKR